MKKLTVLFNLALMTAITSAVAMKSSPKISIEDDEKLEEIIAECNQTFVIQSSYMKALNETGSFPDETDRTSKCYLLCVLKKTGVASDEGVIDPARAAMVIAGQMWGKPMDDIEETATTCASNRTEPCKCERAYQFMKCLIETQIKRSKNTAQ